MKQLGVSVHLALAISCLVPLSAAPPQLQEFRMAARIDHFDITCAPEFDRQAAVIGRRVLFATRAEQMRAVETRTVPGNREHVLLTLDVPETGVDGLLVHELSHVFLFDVLPPNLHRDVPVWILEGLAEYQRGVWEMSDLRLLREMADGGTLPTIIAAAHADSRRAAVSGHAGVSEVRPS